MGFRLFFLPIYLAARSISIIDFSDAEQPADFESEQAWFLGYEAFNFSPELTPLFELLHQTYQIPVVVETGTFEGRSAAGFARIFETVHTIEIANHSFTKTAARLASFPNVVCHLGDSSNILPQLLFQLKEQRLLFYLDAHGEGHWPLISELKIISETHKDHCIVVVDDFKVPERSDISYDAWGNNECSYEYIYEELDQIFTQYECFIAIPKNIAYRAKFIAIPTGWGIKMLQEAGYVVQSPP